jgi:hypothetical protein
MKNNIIKNPLDCVGYSEPLDKLPVFESAPKFINGQLNTSEFVYKLNLPSIEERFNYKGLSLLNLKKHINEPAAYGIYLVDSVFKPEWINWYGINWEDVTRFYKNNYTGRIHDDGHPNKWGINWVVSGYATASFWNLSKIDNVQVVDDEQKKSIKVYNTSHPPCKHYIMPPGAYLFNAGVPHLPSGYNERLVFSLRTKDMPWSQVVNYFSDLIV